MKTSLILLAAGTGARLRSKIPKALLKLNGKPLFMHSLLKFKKMKFLNQIVLVVPSGYEIRFRKNLVRYKINNKIMIITGGIKRVDSVYNGLSIIKPCDFVFIHDSARPFINEFLISELYRGVKKYKAIVPALPLTSALKYCRRGFVEKTLNRKNLYEIQTPQAFSFRVIKKAFDFYNKSNLKEEIWDDSYLVEILDKKVKVIAGDRFNIKITYAQDLKLARAISKIWV